MRLPGENCESTEKLNRDMPYSLCALCLCVFVVKFNVNRIRYTTPRIPYLCATGMIAMLGSVDIQDGNSRVARLPINGRHG